MDDYSKKFGDYSNFYGGILVESKNYEKVITMSKSFVSELGITEEIKWQKVNEYWYDYRVTNKP